jgi:hypothetical protein
MKILWIALLLCAGLVIVLALILPGGSHAELHPAALAGDNPLSHSPDTMVEHLFSPQNASNGMNATVHSVEGNQTALFSKYVSADTRYIVVSLYSGDTADPISVTIITPDKTLGPFYDDSDGIIDGRIDLKISNPDGITPGLWKFLVRSNKKILYGSLENLSWIRTGTTDQKTDE